jgi:hypothetical protein
VDGLVDGRAPVGGNRLTELLDRFEYRWRDLDAEIRKREKQEALELLKNTDANSVSLAGSASLIGATVPTGIDGAASGPSRQTRTGQKRRALQAQSLEEAHSPFVHIFTTALPATNDSCKVLPDSTTSSSFFRPFEADSDGPKTASFAGPVA